MIDSGLKHIFRFYNDIDQQNFRKSWCLQDLSTFKLRCTKKRLLAFQINRASVPDVITQFYLYDANGNFILDLETLLPSPHTTLFYIRTVNDLDYIIYNASQDFTSDLPCGDHYVYISDGVNDWYSEIILIDDFDDNENEESHLLIRDNPKYYLKITDLTDKLNIN